MSWKSIIGQQRIKNILQRALLENRTAHAYCLWGQEGTGKEAIALEFAKTVNCSEPLAGEGSIEACGKCKDCRQTGKLSHRNIEMVYPLPSGEASSTPKGNPIEGMSSGQIEEIRSQLEMKASNPYHKISLKKGNQIKIASIRELKRRLSMPSGFRGRQTAVIFDAERMTTEASNAFLKQLEEPHEGITIFLVTSRRDMILPTILSRCQQLHCPSISEKELALALMERHGIPEVEAKIITNFAQGSYTRALQFMDESFTELRHEIVEIMRTALKKRNFRAELLEKIEFLAKNNDKNGIEINIQLLIIWLRDAYMVARAGAKDQIINIDQGEVISRFAEAFGKKDIPAAIDCAEKAIFRIKRNVQIKLLLLALFVELRNIFLGTE